MLLRLRAKERGRDNRMAGGGGAGLAGTCPQPLPFQKANLALTYPFGEQLSSLQAQKPPCYNVI